MRQKSKNLKRIAKDFVEGIKPRIGTALMRPISARIGNPNDSTVFVSDGVFPDNKRVFIHYVTDGDVISISKALTGQFTKKDMVYDRPVKVLTNDAGFDYIAGFEEVADAIYSEGIEEQDDQLPVNNKQLIEQCTLHPASSGLIIQITEGMVGNTRYVGGSTDDFSSGTVQDTAAANITLPTTNGQAKGVLIQFDKDNNAIEFKQSSAFDSILSLKQAYTAGLLPTKDANRVRLGYAKLVKGMSASSVFTYDLLWSCPEFIEASYELSNIYDFVFNDATELTLDNNTAGAVTITQSYHSIDTNADASTGELATISGGTAGQVLYIFAISDVRDIVVKNATGNILTYDGSDITLDEDHKIVELIYSGTNWRVVNVTGSSGATTALDNLASVQVNTDIIPDTDATHDLGSSAARWAEGWFNDILGDLEIEVYNASGSDILLEKVVYISGFNVGQALPEISLADADAGSGAELAIGITKQTISNLSTGRIVIRGRATYPTTGLSVGDRLFLDTTAGALTTTRPTTGKILEFGEVLRIAASTIGLILVNPQGLNDLDATETLANKTLTTPAIGDFTNATHTHTNNAGGGTLSASAIASGTLAHERGGLEADVSAYGGVPLISSGATTQLKYNLSASAAPIATDDSSAGYTVGSLWIDTTNDKAYQCLDATASAAVWTEITQSGGGSIGGSTGATDNAVIRADGTGGSTVQSSELIIDDNNKLTIPDNATVGRLNITPRSVAPTTPAPEDIYLDDGTNRADGLIGFRQWNAVSWDDLVDGSGFGNVSGPISSTDNAVARWDSLTGELLQNSAVTIDDSGNMSAAKIILTTPLAILDGGTAGSTAAAARTNLGLAIGTDVQAYDAELTEIAALLDTKGNIIVGNGTAWVALGVGADGQVLQADSAQSAGIKWASGASGSTPTLYYGFYMPTSAISTTSSTYADVDGTNIKQSITLSGGETIIVEFHFPRWFQVTGGTGTMKLVAGTTDADTLHEPTCANTASPDAGVTVHGRWTGLGAGTFDFKPQFKTSANTSRVGQNNAVTWIARVY